MALIIIIIIFTIIIITINMFIMHIMWSSFLNIPVISHFASHFFPELQPVWSEDAVKFFLGECQRSQENGSFSPEVSLWTEIASIMTRNGYHFSIEQIQRKWCSLCEQFFNSSTQCKPFEYDDLMKTLVSGSRLTKQELLHEESPSSCGK